MNTNRKRRTRVEIKEVKELVPDDNDSSYAKDGNYSVP